MRRSFALVALLLGVATGLASRRAAADEPPAPTSHFTPPRVLVRVAAPYPDDAQRLGLSATVVLDVDLDETGAVTSVVVKAGAGHGFDEAAVAALKAFRFSPAASDGTPVPSRVTYAYKFVLRTVEKPMPVADDAVRLRGALLLRGTRAPIGGATVTAVPEEIWRAARNVKGAQTIRPEDRVQGRSDEHGGFVMHGLTPGGYHLVIVGPHARRFEVDEQVGAHDVLTVKYYLEPDQYTRYESTVRADPNREEISRVSLKTEELMKLPGTFGDALRAIENLPGVARAPFNSGLLIIRGAKPTDSRVFLSGGEVPQLYHFGGLRSVVPTELIDRIDYFPGNFSVRWGRAIGGAVDLDLRSPRTDRFHGSVEVNVFDVGATFEGPIGKGGFFVAARRSYIDAVLPLVFPSNAGLSFTSAPVYYDYQAAFEYPLGPGKIRLLASGADDQLKLVFAHPSDGDPLLSSFGTHIGYHRLQLRWTGRVEKWQLFLQNSTGYTTQDGEVGRSLNYNIWNVGTDFRLEAKRPLGPRFQILFGLDTQYSYVNLGAKVPPAPQEGQIISPISASQLTETQQRFNVNNIGAYAELKWTPTEKVTVTPGFRFDYYSVLQRQSFDPRLSGRFHVAKYTWLKTGLGLYSQPPQPPDYNPQYGNPNVAPEKAVHAALSIEQGLLPGLMLEVGGFYKHLYDLATTSDELILKDGHVAAERVASTGIGRVYGGEFLLRQSISKHFFGWISYTLMRSERKDCDACGWRLFDFDQTHVLIVALHGYLPKGWEVGLRFRYLTGFPITRAYGGYYDADADVYAPAQGPVNTGRLSAYHALDLRVDKTFLFKKWVLKIYLDVTNVYDRANQEIAQPGYDYTRVSAITGLPIIPSFGIRGEF